MLSDIVATAAVLADPTRVRMLAWLDRPRSAGELAARVGISPSSGSYHLRRLKEVGLVSVEQQGKRRLIRRLSARWRNVWAAFDDDRHEDPRSV